MIDHKIGSREEWLAAREKLLEREKEHARLGDELARQRRELPWVRVEKDYLFDTDEGPRTLRELFGGRSQLLVYHFMFGPKLRGRLPNQLLDRRRGKRRPPTLARPRRDHAPPLACAAGQAPGLQAAHGWSIPWVSDTDSGFSSDYGFSSTEEQTREWLAPMLESGILPPIVEHNARATGTDPVSYLSEGFGFTAFVLDDDVVYHTYSTTARGVEFLMGYYAILDRAPKGRDERDGFQLWIRRHDEYDGE